MLRNNKGFTLIEIIVVIIILGIISAIAVPQVIGNVKNSKVAVVKQNLEIVKTAINAYYAQNGNAPTAAQADTLIAGKTLAQLGIVYTPGTPYTLVATVTNAAYGLAAGDAATANFPTTNGYTDDSTAGTVTISVTP